MQVYPPSKRNVKHTFNIFMLTVSLSLNLKMMFCFRPIMELLEVLFKDFSFNHKQKNVN